MPNWKTNLAASWVAQFLCIVGFSAALPFTPFYVRDLGVTDPDEIATWAAALASGSAIAMAFISPVWGIMADRHGRKIMVQRAAYGGAVLMALMGIVANVQQFMVLRVTQGLFTGTVPAFIALVASFTPAENVGFSLGVMQMAVYTGFSVGPMIGGLVADHLGYRSTFFATGVLLLAGAVLTTLVIRERFVPPVKKKSSDDGLGGAARAILGSLPMLGGIVALGGIYAANSAPQPLLPLFVEELAPLPGLVNTSTGLIFGVNAGASALSAIVLGRLSDRLGFGSVLVACGIGSAAVYLGQAVSPTLGLLIGLNFLAGLFAGGLLPSTNAMLARTAPADKQGAIYGISNSVNAVGRAAGPVLGAWFAKAWGIRAAFVVPVIIFTLVTVWVRVILQRHPVSTEETVVPTELQVRPDTKT